MQDFTDIYSRVKRQRKTVKRDMYGMPIETDNEDVEENEEDDDDENEGKETSEQSTWLVGNLPA